MKLANKAFILALTMLTLVFSMSAQSLRPLDDPRNTAPTVGTGGPPGGPTGLFTVYDGQTLRRGEFTFSAAYSNYDRDPGDADIVEVPVSFQIGLSDHVELFFNTDAYRAIKVNSPRNLSGFYLPNSQIRVGNSFFRPPAIVLGTATGGNTANQAVFRPQVAGFSQFPFVGGTINGNLGVVRAGVAGNNGADAFPGLGSVFGSILPGIVLQTNRVGTGTSALDNPTVFTLAPSYLPDAPFINREFGESSFNTFTVGGKIRFTGPNNPYGFGIIPFYRFYMDNADDSGGFNQLQRGSSAGGGGYNPFSSNRGDVGLVLFGDARLRKWMNVSANIGYVYNSSVKGDLGGGEVTLLDRPDEVLAGVALDFPVNRYFQPILEFRSTQYVGGRTPNAFENSPLDGLAGARVFPTRWFSIGGAYRYHFNQQDRDSFEGDEFSTTATIVGAGAGTTTTRFTGVPPGFRTSTDPHGFILQVTAGHRNARTEGKIENKFADVTNLEVSETRVTTPCGPGFRPAEGANCSDDMSVNVVTTAIDPESDVLTYNYTVSGGRIVGQGANVQWDLTGVAPGSYTITAGVDDGCGVCGKTQTRTVAVEACNCVAIAPVCECATLTVSGPTGEAAPGDVLTFTANLAGGTTTDYTYEWTVTQGTIIEGQGTQSIRVQTTPEMVGQNVTATFNIRSAICEVCNRSEATTFSFPAAPESVLTTVGAVSNDEVRGILDNYFIELQNDPTSRGVIINSGTAREITRRETLIRNHIRLRKFDASRIEFLRGGDRGTGIETRLYRVPAGYCTDCRRSITVCIFSKM